MKVTQNTLISDLKNITTSGSNPIDYRIEDSQFAYWCDQARSTLISQALQKRQDISDIWLQPITCLDMIQVDPSECCEVDTGCKVLRTELRLPATIETMGDNSIVRVEDNMGNPIARSKPFYSKYDKYSKYASSIPQWIFKNGYIYVLNNDFISQINVIGLWDSPSELAAFTNCEGSTCFNKNSDYPCSLKMAEQIVDYVLKKKVYPFIQLPQDTTNDSSDRFNTPPTTNLK